MINIILTLVGIASMLLGIYIFRKHWKESRVFVVLFSLAFFLLGSTFILLQFYYVFPNWMGDKSVFSYKDGKVEIHPYGFPRGENTYSFMVNPEQMRLETRNTIHPSRSHAPGIGVVEFTFQVEDFEKFAKRAISLGHHRIYPSDIDNVLQKRQIEFAVIWAFQGMPEDSEVQKKMLDSVFGQILKEAGLVMIHHRLEFQPDK